MLPHSSIYIVLLVIFSYWLCASDKRDFSSSLALVGTSGCRNYCGLFPFSPLSLVGLLGHYVLGNASSLTQFVTCQRVSCISDIVFDAFGPLIMYSNSLFVIWWKCNCSLKYTFSRVQWTALLFVWRFVLYNIVRHIVGLCFQLFTIC